eukprot:TRINITY_DN589_c0_g1_i1.p1 TRINITY_DN589_c0_g1~~TRINITY_DN589_c0_g1_i1.p1  ORF type:complete len:380 (+),score=89.53 TRINITY_DN589_c0_g1_i1:43-1182(+)
MPSPQSPNRAPIPPTPGTVTSTTSGPQCAICMSGLADGKVLEPCEHAICMPCFGTWAQTCRCAIPGVPPECIHCSSGKVECPFCRELTTHPAESKNDQRRRKVERDQRHALRRARERHAAEQRAGGYVKKNFKIKKNVEGTIGVRFRGREVTEVLQGTPAYTTGIRQGMRIKQIEGTAVQDHSDAVHDALKSAPTVFMMTVDAPKNQEREREAQQQPPARVERPRQEEREREAQQPPVRVERPRQEERERVRERVAAQPRPDVERQQKVLAEMRERAEREKEKEKQRLRDMEKERARAQHKQLHNYRQNHHGMWQPVSGRPPQTAHNLPMQPQYRTAPHHDHMAHLRNPYALPYGNHRNGYQQRPALPHHHPHRPLNMP